MGKKSKNILSQVSNYEEFLSENRKRVNTLLNNVLWVSVLTGPAIALGIWLKLFEDIDYSICHYVSLYLLAISVLHLFVLRKWPNSLVTSLIALLALDFLLVILTDAFIAIEITWFLVPLLSPLYCDFRLYSATVIVNYILMGLATWVISPIYSGVRIDFDKPLAYFLNTFGGYTIEMFLMMMAGFALAKLANGYFKDLIEKYKKIKEHEDQMREQMELLDSMAEIYDRVDLIDLKKMTELSLRGGELTENKIDITESDHTLVNRQLRDQIAKDQLDDFWTFTNLKTIRKRLSDKKIIYGEFVNMITGWFRAQYITVDFNDDGEPDKIFYTIQNIDNEKRREEHLLRVSLTDELTRLYNRRCYDDDMAVYKTKPLEDDFVILSIDVNGLKMANDTKGHAAGDELLRGAANCLVATIGSMGKVYRVGGDEFLAVIKTDKYNDICDAIHKKTASWHGAYVDTVSVAVGYAAHKVHPEASVEELEKLADAMMYTEKEKYYHDRGIDRSGQSTAYSALCSDLLKILVVNLTTDAYKIISMDNSEKEDDLGYSEKFSEWITKFAKRGGVYADDKDAFLEKTSLEYLKEYFQSGKHSLSIFYKRKNGNEYEKVMMELLRDEDYSDTNQSLYLSVKKIEE